MKVSRFEELLVWQKAQALCIEVYRVSSKGGLSRDFGLRDQMQRAAVPVMSNIAETFDRNSRAEFARFLSIARGSAGELRSQLYVTRELEYIDQNEFERLMALCSETTRMLISLRKSLGA
jgi:four helix bundle protein